MSNLESFAELIRLANVDKAAREAADLVRKQNEVAPLLSELFETVSKAKAKETDKKPVQELSVEPSATKTIDDGKEQYLKHFKSLQADFQALKKYVDTKSSRLSNLGTSGGGEVRVLRMDDVDKSNLEQDSILSYEASDKKLHFNQVYDKVFSNVINKETVILEDMSYSVIGYLKIKSALHVKGNLGIR